MGKSVYLPHEADDPSLIPRAHNGRTEWTTKLSLMHVHLYPQQAPDGGVESAQPMLSERHQAQLAACLICMLSVVSQALQPPAGLGASLALLRIMGGQTQPFGAAHFYSFPLCPSGDDLASLSC